MFEYINFEIGRLNYCLGEFDNAVAYLFPLINGVNKDFSLIALGKAYVALSDFEKAKDCFSKALNTKNSVVAAYELGLIAAKEGHQKELLQMIENILKTSPGFFNDRSFLLYYVEGINNKIKVLNECYSIKQMKSYSKDAALQHIKEHKYNSTTKQSTFRENIDLMELYDEVLPLLNEETYFKSTPSDNYVIPHPFIGSEGEQFLKVITNLNTSEIITMYPTSLYDDVLNATAKNNSKELKRTR